MSKPYFANFLNVAFCPKCGNPVAVAVLANRARETGERERCCFSSSDVVVREFRSRSDAETSAQPSFATPINKP
jgi:hypothetical protein